MLKKEKKVSCNGDKQFMKKLYDFVGLDQQVEIAEEFLTPEIMQVFKDAELRQSVDAFFDNNLNISETSRNAYMHRNTLLYRIDKIHKLTGLNIRNFHDAVLLYELEEIYERTKNLR